MTDIEKCEKTIASLEERRRLHVEKGLALADERAAIAFKVHGDNDAKARQRLTEINNALVVHASEHESICAAVKEAEARLEAAKAAAAQAEDRAQAKLLRAAVAEFVECGRRVDHALSLLAADGYALVETHQSSLGLVVMFPSGQQLDSLGHICLRTAIMSTPWSRSVEAVPPNQRRSFRSLIEAWTSNIEQNNIGPRLGEQSTEAA